MTETSAHDEKVKDLMGAKVLMSGVEKGQLERIDDAADGIDDTAGYKPEKSCARQGSDQRNHGEDTEPSHGDVDQRRKPFWTGDPESFDQDSGDGGSPDQKKERITDGIPQRDHTDRCITSGDQDKDHHMIDFAKNAVNFLGYVQRMIDGARAVEQDHAERENGKRRDRMSAVFVRGEYKKRCGSRRCQDHTDKMSDGAAGVFNG